MSDTSIEFKAKAIDLDPNRQIFKLFHYGEEIGKFRLGDDPHWWPTDERYNDIFPIHEGETIPTFLRNLMPEGWLGNHLKWNSRDEKIEQQETYISEGMRFLSNFIIKRDGERKPRAKNDVILQRLADYVDEKGKFIGDYKGPNGRSCDKTFQEKLETIWGNRNTARYSGAELKTPHCLNEDGNMYIARNRPFGLILKHSGRDGADSLGMNEFMCLSATQASGLETPTFCVIEQDDGLPPIYAIERYDIPHIDDPSDSHLLTQDFCTLLGNKSENKDDGTLLAVAKKMAEMSDAYNPENTKDNLKKILHRAVLSWVLNDGDMHLKNLSVLISYDDNDKHIESVNFSPTYDVTSDVRSGRHGMAQVLSIEGKKNKLNMKTFVNFAKRFNLFEEGGQFSPEKAAEFVKDVASKAAFECERIYQNPPIKTLSDDIQYDMSVIVTHAVERAKALGAKTPEWDCNQVWSEYNEKGLGRRFNESDTALVQKTEEERIRKILATGMN